MPNFTVKEKNAPSTTSKPDEGPPVRPTTYFSNMVDNVAGTVFYYRRKTHKLQDVCPSRCRRSEFYQGAEREPHGRASLAWFALRPRPRHLSRLEPPRQPCRPARGNFCGGARPERLPRSLPACVLWLFRRQHRETSSQAPHWLGGLGCIRERCEPLRVGCSKPLDLPFRKNQPA